MSLSDSAGGYLTLGNPVFGTSDAGSPETYTVYLQAGVAYDLGVSGIAQQAGYAPSLSLYAPNGTLIGSTDPATGFLSVESLAYTPTGSGTYTVTLASSAGTGYYSAGCERRDVSADDYRADRLQAIDLGERPVKGKLDIANDSDGFLLATETGHRYYVEAQGSIDVQVDVQNQASQSLVGTSNSTPGQAWFIAPDEDKALVVVSAHAHDQTGSYTLYAAQTYSDDAKLVIGTAAAETFTGSAGSDEIHGSWGRDTIDGGAGDDFLDAGWGKDTDVLKGGAGDDYASASAGNCLLDGGSGNDDLWGWTGRDTLTGGAGDDVLDGDAGKDQLSGGAGSDVLYASAGSDRLAGGRGEDLFVLYGASGSDTIVDFASGADTLGVMRSELPIGDGDARVDGAMTRATRGGFGTKAELVIFRADAVDLSAASAAKTIGPAKGAYHLGQTALFVVDDGHDSALYLFKAGGADAKVSASELTLLATFEHATNLHAADFWYGA